MTIPCIPIPLHCAFQLDLILWAQRRFVHHVSSSMRVLEDHGNSVLDTTHELAAIDTGDVMGIKLHHRCAQSKRLDVLCMKWSMRQNSAKIQIVHFWHSCFSPIPEWRKCVIFFFNKKTIMHNHPLLTVACSDRVINLMSLRVWRLLLLVPLLWYLETNLMY